MALHSLIHDLRIAVRYLLRNPAFTCVALATVAVSLGINLTGFAVVDAVLLRPLPFPAPDRLVTLYNSYPKVGRERGESSYLNYFSRRGNLDTFSHLAAWDRGSAIVGEEGSTATAEICRVSPEFFPALGIRPVLGRSFYEEEMTFQSDTVVILTHAFWRRHFNADPAILGKSIRVDGLAKVIVGVLPSSFRFLSSQSQIYLPLSVDPDLRRLERLHNGGFELIGRLRPGISLAQAQAQVDVHNALQNRDFPYRKDVEDAGFRTVVAPLRAEHVASIRPTLVMLQAGLLCLLFIAASNLVNFLLVRAASRRPEFAIRQALGAGRVRVARQLLLEALLIASSGGLLGLALATLGVRLLPVLGLQRLPMGADIQVDARLVLATAGATAFVAAAMSLPAMWLAIRCRPCTGNLVASRSGAATQVIERVRQAFIVAQVAIAFILLAGAGLLGASLRQAMAVSPGFQALQVLSGRISLPWSHYRDGAARLAFADRVMESVRSQPGVAACGIATAIPASPNHEFNVMRLPGHQPELASPPILHNRHGVSGDYFEAMGIPLKQGRYLVSSDSHRAQRVCVVDEEFARTYWPGQSALGKHVSEGPDERDPSQWFTIVGVVGAIKQSEVTEATPGRALYLPYRHNPSSTLGIAVRTRGVPDAFAADLQRIVRNLDPELPVDDLRTMESRLADGLQSRRSPALLALALAFIALTLAAVGTYSVLAYAVAQRRREIGVRMALGALPSQIARQFLTFTTRLLILGTAFGLTGAWMAGKALQTILFRVPTFHPPTLLAALCVLTLTALAASLLPARRAAAVDPMSALRDD